MKPSVFIITVCCLAGFNLVAAEKALSPVACTNLLSVKRIWHSGQHCAFTDLLRYKEQWFCTFRESQAHVGGNGKIRVLQSKAGEDWQPAGLVSEEGIDLRDPKLSIAPDGRLMLSLGGSVYEGKVLKERQSRVAFSKDGQTWTPPQRILEKGDWLWRVTWHESVGYGIAYSSGTNKQSVARLVSTTNGISYTTVTKLDVSGSPNEATIRFLPAGKGVILVRRETEDREAWVGVAAPPYQAWKWHSSKMQIGGPNFIAVNGAMIASGRQYGKTTKDARTFVGTMTSDRVSPDLILPSGGDCSYPGMVFESGTLWLSYYSSHEGSADIYLAKIGCHGAGR